MDQLQQQPFDLAIVDCQMPDMSGLDLAQLMRQILPEMRIIMISGCPPPEMGHAIEQKTVDGYLDKPFSLSQLLAVINQVEI